MDNKTIKSQAASLEKSKNTSKVLVEKSGEKNVRRDVRGWSKAELRMLIGGAAGLVAGVACLLVGLLMPQKVGEKWDFAGVFHKEEKQDNIYSKLTGEALSSVAEQVAPTYCVQIPNGTDGGRPQAGLTEAGVVFEAIAEAGITRFAAIFQNPTAAIIGPVRSLRTYYLQWDTPFGCTIVHAGGSGDALEAVAAGGYQDLSEDYAYMYRGSNSARLWNNLFTTAAALEKFATGHGYTTSEVKGFARMTPEEAERARVAATVGDELVITEPASDEKVELVEEVRVNFSAYASYNVVYEYDAKSNTYLRSYATGAEHEVYECEGANGDLGGWNPEDACELVQMAPTVVVAMMVDEALAADAYHEDISTVGTGEVYVFQNGTVVEGSWVKGSVADQIKFFDVNGEELKLVPGQTFVEAVPKSYGGVEF